MTEEGFRRIWKSAARYRHVSRPLETLVREAYVASLLVPPNEAVIIRSLEALLSFLASPEGRTDANCCATDFFFSAEWEGDWAHLSSGVQEILGAMGGALHETIYAPQIASNFSSLPEQLLLRLRAVR